MARPEEHTPEIIAEICDGLSDGITLSEICRRDHMPQRRTVYDWTAKHPDIAARIARAREDGFDVIAEQCIEIAEDGTNDYTTRKNQAGQDVEVFDSEHVQRSKLRIETRLKLLAKWSPKKYGDRQQVAPTDPDGNAIAMPQMVFVARRPKPVEEKPE